jgi:hypothetical protein
VISIDSRRIVRVVVGRGFRAHRCRLFRDVCLIITILAAASRFECVAQKTPESVGVSIRFVDALPDANYPELLYWFLTPETLRNEQYLKDVEHIVHDSPFTLAFLTPRMGTDVFDARTHDGIARLVAVAHQHGLKIGLQIPLARSGSQSDRLDNQTTLDDQTTISEAEVTLDANGEGLAVLRDEMRHGKPLASHLLRAYIFRKTSEGEYAAGSLHDVTEEAHADINAPGVVQVRLLGNSTLAGMTAYIMVENTYDTLDLFSEAFISLIHRRLDQYRDVPLDGTALDEFGYMSVPHPLQVNFRDRFGGKAFAAAFERERKLSFAQTLFDMRYSPAGHPEVRIRAIDEYWDHLREGPLRIEEEVYRYSRHLFGEQVFAGIHDTFHNHLTNDEAWATGINWWRIPRQYGQSDEDLSLPLRMGLLVSHPGKIMYDQFYGWDIPPFAVKAMRDALYDARLHYHGYNDTGRWGRDLSSEEFLSVINPVERKIRLLNQFDPAAPELPLLVVFGMPAQLNWFPDKAVRNAFDLNGSLDIEGKVQQIWDAGYRCAVVPSDLIDSGALTLDINNHPVLNGHKFSAMVYLYPQYSKASTLAFLDHYTRAGGSLMTEGSATRDFVGHDVTGHWATIAAHAQVDRFDLARLGELGISRDALAPGGSMLEDGSSLRTDLASIQKNEPKNFQFNLAGHIYTGSFIGTVALKVDEAGRVEKFACGQCSGLQRDGKTILRITKPHDLILRKDVSGYHMLIQGHEDAVTVTLTP